MLQLHGFGSVDALLASSYTFTSQPDFALVQQLMAGQALVTLAWRNLYQETHFL